MNKYLILFGLVLAGATASAQYLSQDEALKIACDEARAINFDFDGNMACEDEVDVTEQGDDFVFEALDASGDCQIRLRVNRQSGAVVSSVSCM